MSWGRKDNNIRGPVRRAADAHGARQSRRAFRPLRWAWLLLLVALLAPTYDLFFPAGYSPSRDRRTVVIERGQTLHEISRELQRVGVIRSQVGFLVLARAMRLDRSVKAGQYSFRVGITVPSLLRALDRGMYGLNLVTIPEGLMVRETAMLIERQVGIAATSIDSLARDPDLLDSLEIGAPSLEGWLAPDSYEWLPGTSPEVVLRTMVARTRERVQRATAGYDSLPLGMNAHEVLTLASIVESESRAREERPRIARVYLNRLDRGMLLQADPTVGYALGRGPRSRLTFKDLRVESPYNTYRHEGLPPGPICSPGAAAIEAIMNATPGVKDLYFVARGEGRHIFAPTYEQHLANIAYVRGKQAAVARADDDDVVGADVDSTLPRPKISKPAAPAVASGTQALAPTTPSLKPSGPAALVAGTAKPQARTVAGTPDPPAPSPLKGTLLTPRSTIKTAGSTPVTSTLVKSAVVDTGKARALKLATKPARPDTSRARASNVTAKPAVKSTTPETTPSRATSVAAKPAVKPAAKAATPDTSRARVSTPAAKPAAKPARPDTSRARVSNVAAKPAVKPATTTATPAPKAPAKPAPRPAAKDTSKTTPR